MQNNNLLKKFLSFSIGSWLGIIISFVSTPVITRLLSPEEFGRASMFLLVMNVLLLVSMLGTDQSFTRFFYEEKESSRNHLLFNCLKVSLSMFGILSLFALLFYKPLSEFLFSEIEFGLVALLLVAVLIQILSRFAVLVIRMEQKGFIFSLIQILSKLFDFLGVVVFAYFISADYTAMVYSQILTGFLVTVLAVIFSYSYWNWKKAKLHQAKHNIKDITTYGIPLALTLLITWLFQSTDRIAIKHWGEYSDLGLYAAAFKVVAILNIIQTTFTTFWVPVSYERYEKNPEDKAFFSEIFQLVSLGLFLIAIGTIMFKDVIVWLLGAEYKKAAYIMPFLVFMPLMYTVSEITVVGINFAKKTKWHILISLGACVLNILGNVICVPFWGAKGAALSTGISYILFALLRTGISYTYFKVDYRLKKFLINLFLIFAYAFYNTFYDTNTLNYILGLLLIVIVIYFYRDSFTYYLNKPESVMD